MHDIENKKRSKEKTHCRVRILYLKKYRAIALVGIFIFIFRVLFSTLLHLPPLLRQISLCRRMLGLNRGLQPRTFITFVPLTSACSTCQREKV